MSSGAIDVDGRTPFNKLWGGWFVTGATVPAGHAGNVVFEDSVRRELTPSLDPRFSLTRSSDIVALMVFAHQMRVMNLLAHPDNADELADALLFADEPPLPSPIRGSSGFRRKNSPAPVRAKATRSRSLRGISDLERRLMRYPCSYMIYSEAFDALPSGVKEAVYRRMWLILSGGSTAPADRKAVVEILRDTKPDLPKYFQR